MNRGPRWLPDRIEIFWRGAMLTHHDMSSLQAGRIQWSSTHLAGYRYFQASCKSLDNSLHKVQVVHEEGTIPTPLCYSLRASQIEVDRVAAVFHQTCSLQQRVWIIGAELYKKRPAEELRSRPPYLCSMCLWQKTTGCPSPSDLAPFTALPWCEQPQEQLLEKSAIDNPEAVMHVDCKKCSLRGCTCLLDKL